GVADGAAHQSGTGVLKNMKLQIAKCKLRIGVAAIFFALAANAVAADEIIDRVLAVVAGDIIMMSDVTAARDLGLLPPANAADPTREVLSRLIDRSLVLAEVDRYAPPEPTAEAIAAEEREVAARFQTQQALARTLQRVGLDETRLNELLRQNLRIRAYL